jgi:8-oxo-dGTP pyrophosphatase MutT (NUDIX family)
MSASRGSVVNLLHRYRPADPTEAADVARVLALAQTAEDAWARALPLHLTGSAVIVHPDSARVLLRWHPRQLSWLQVGGHGDPGETDAFDVAVREGREETGLADLVAWPAPGLIHLAVVAVPANDREPARSMLTCACSGHEDSRGLRPRA